MIPHDPAPTPRDEPRPHDRIAGDVALELLSAAGQFERPGSKATIEPTVIVVTVPATIVPR